MQPHKKQIVKRGHRKINRPLFSLNFLTSIQTKVSFFRVLTRCKVAYLSKRLLLIFCKNRWLSSFILNTEIFPPFAICFSRPKSRLKGGREINGDDHVFHNEHVLDFPA